MRWWVDSSQEPRKPKLKSKVTGDKLFQFEKVTALL